jgi:hypothetical protein
VQDTLTLALAPLFGTKSLFTVNEALFRLLMIVQECVPPFVIATLAHAVWLAV